MISLKKRIRITKRIIEKITRVKTVTCRKPRILKTDHTRKICRGKKNF